MNDSLSRRPTPSALRYLLYFLLSLVAIALPVLLSRTSLPIIAFTYSRESVPFELFGFSAALAIALILLFELRRRDLTRLDQVLPVVVPALVGIYVLYLITDYSTRTWDYYCYEGAANALVHGLNPYYVEQGDETLGSCYVYPPLTAQVMAWFFRLFAGTTVPDKAAESLAWDRVFYLFQTVQLFLVIAAAALSYRFARRLGMNALPAGLLVAALFVFNNPLLRTVRHNQVNLWTLVLVMAAILLLPRYPWISGLALALAIHIKITPGILVLVWLLTRRWKAVLGTLAGFAGILFLQTGFGMNWTTWRQFLEFLLDPLGNLFLLRFPLFRDNSPHGILENVMRFAGILTTPPGTAPWSLFGILSGLVILATVAWFSLRFVQHERIWREDASSGEFRVDAHSMDALALTLLVPPMVWEHHYVIAVPIVIWAVATSPRNRLWIVAVAAALMLAVPTFDLFPFSYHRVAGLLMLLLLAAPRAMEHDLLKVLASGPRPQKPVTQQ
jgi:hypothetical protein